MSAIHMNEQQFHDRIKEDKPLLVDFWAPWCTYCRRIGPAFDKVAQQYQDQLDAVKINIDENNALADAEKIEVIPTLILYRGGKAIGSVVAPESKAVIDDFINRTLSSG